jgi:dihydroflavonol-4-reductase
MILITGATGCLGSNLVRALVERGERVAIFRRPEDKLDSLEGIIHAVEHRLGDVRDADSVERAMRGVEKVFHVAGIALPLNALHGLMMEVNVRGTENVARAALRQGVRRMVYTSSASAVGFPPRGSVATESFTFNGDVHGHSYAVSKHLGERAVLEQVALGLDAVIVNPTAVMAPGGDLEQGWASLVLRIMRRQSPFYPSGGFGFLTRKDMVDGHLKAMERGLTGHRYILNTANLSYQELCQLIAEVVGVPPPRWLCPDMLLRFAGALGSLVSKVIRNPARLPMLVRENVFLMTHQVHYDQSKALRELGFSQSPIQDAIREIHQWCTARVAAR